MNRLFGAQRGPPTEQNQPPQKEQEEKPEENTEEKQEEVQEPPKQLDLTEQSERMEQKCNSLNDQINKIDKEIADNYAKAKNAKGSNQKIYKQRCVMLMKKRKLYQDQLGNFMNQQFTLDQVAFTKENIQNTLEMGKAMKEAVAQQKILFEQVNMDELEDIRDDMEEMKLESEEINEMLNRNYDVDIDEADLDDEMKALDDELFQEALANNSNTDNQQQQQQNQQQQMQSNILQNQLN